MNHGTENQEVSSQQVVVGNRATEQILLTPTHYNLKPQTWEPRNSKLKPANYPDSCVVIHKIGYIAAWVFHR